LYDKEKSEIAAKTYLTTNELKVRYEQEKTALNAQISKQSQQIIDASPTTSVKQMKELSTAYADINGLETALTEHKQEVAKLTQENTEWDKILSKVLKMKLLKSATKN
jgi:NAD(P)H-hydrate repair Nnr-like enzyme with NAD(P)H-hydrate dehydratase domain